MCPYFGVLKVTCKVTYLQSENFLQSHVQFTCTTQARGKSINQHILPKVLGNLLSQKGSIETEEYYNVCEIGKKTQIMQIMRKKICSEHKVPCITFIITL